MKTSLIALGLAVLMGVGLSLNAQSVDSGTFMLNQNTKGYNLHQNTGEREFTVEVKFNKKFESKPEIVLAVTSVDAEKTTNLRYALEKGFVSEEGFLLKVRTWADTKVYSLGGNWLAVSGK